MPIRPLRSISAPDTGTVLRLIYRLSAMMLVAVLLLASHAYAQQFPELTGRVVDAANILDPAQEAALTAKLENLEQQSQRQLVVATIPDLQGYEIADYGYRLGDHWGVGDKERDDGVILIVAPNDRKVRIEVGYGLEGILPDILAGRIIRNAIIPRFKADDYPGGISAGVDEITRLLLLPPEEARKVAQQAKQEASDNNDNGQLIFILFIIFIFFILPMIRRRRRGRAYRGGIAPVIIWGPGSSSGSSHGWGGGGWSVGGGFSGGGGSFGGGGASGGW
ncbi:MAG: YgcG family protein [Sphingobium sp.]|nr:YgcG family protein [Sphingobium sp.]MCP5398998.1 YgcG family protein [Sphingomonas sp.]